MKADNVIVRSTESGGFQFKRQEGVIGEYNISYESPIFDAITCASVINANVILEYPMSIFIIDEKQKVVQRRHGQSEYIVEEEIVGLPKLMYEDLSSEAFFFPHTYSHPDLQALIDTIVEHNLSYLLCHKFDGTQERVRFCQSYMILLNCSKCIKLSQPVNVDYIFLAEYMSTGDIILYDVCINAVVGKRIAVLNNLPKCAEFQIQLFEEKFKAYSLMDQSTTHPTDGYIVSFSWMKHQYKKKLKPTIDVLVEEDYLISGDNIALCSTPAHLKQYTGNVVEITCYGDFVCVRSNKSQGNELFSIYCTFKSEYL
jgi:hypothetical protein